MNNFVSKSEVVLSRQIISMEDTFGNDTDVRDFPDIFVYDVGEVTKIVDIVTSVLV